MKRTVHLVAGSLAGVMIAAFWLSTVLAELLALNLRDGLRLTGRIPLAGQGVPHVR